MGSDIKRSRHYRKCFHVKVLKVLKESFLQTLAVLPGACVSCYCCSMVSDQSAYFDLCHMTSSRYFSSIQLPARWIFYFLETIQETVVLEKSLKINSSL